MFEVRYFVGAVPLVLLLLARGADELGARGRPWSRRVRRRGGALLALGLADQQLNGSNPRVYDFKGAVHAIEDRARPGDVVVYSPQYVDTVVGYYERDGLKTRPLDDGLPKPRRGQRVFLLGQLPRQAAVPRRDRGRRPPPRRAATTSCAASNVPQIRTWEFRR